MNKYITIISYSLVLSYLPDTVYAQACFSAPSCQSLGYTKTIASCPEGINYLLCPYDSTYIYCPENCNLFPLSDGECDSSIGVCEQCSDPSKWRYISCNDGWYKKNDKCVENECYGYSPEQPNITGCSKINTCKKANQTYYENICSSCETGYELKDGECKKIYNIGDIYYYNNTPIGVVFYDDSSITKITALNDIDNSGVASVYSKIYYLPNSNYFDIPEVSNVTDAISARKDMNGKDNTNKTLSYISKNNKSVPAVEATQKYAPSVCTTDSMCGIGNWYLPAAGEMRSIHINLDIIQSSIINAGGHKLITTEDTWYYHTSSECGAEKNVHFNLNPTVGSEDDEGNPWCGGKYNPKYVRPCLEIAK